MSEAKKVSSPKKPKPLEDPKAKNEITVAFINKFFSYKRRLASYNYRTDKTDENKKKWEAAKTEHTEWLDYVGKTYNGTVKKEKTTEIINHFIDTYYPNLPKKTTVVLGKFK